MKIDPKIKFKSETGNSPFIKIESESVAYSDDSEGIKNANCVFVAFLPVEYQESHYCKIPTPEYIEWLESKFDSDLF